MVYDVHFLFEVAFTAKNEQHIAYDFDFENLEYFNKTFDGDDVTKNSDFH